MICITDNGYNLVHVLLSLQILAVTKTVGGIETFKLKATYYRGRVNVSWDAVPDASKYKIINKYKSYNEEWITTNTTFGLPDADKYTFIISANSETRLLVYSEYFYYNTPKKVFSRTGRSVSFNIEYTVADINLIKNKDNGKTLFTTGRYNVHSSDTAKYSANTTWEGMSAGMARLSMTINNVQMTDAGYIVGYLNNSEEGRDIGVLLIVYEVSKPVIRGPREVQSGETANLTCSTTISYQPDYYTIKRHITYVWYRNNSEPKVKRKSVLTSFISYESRDMAYTCLVEFNRVSISNMSDPFIFQITSPASITGVYINGTKVVRKGQTVSVTTGQSVSVKCTAAGFPPPDITCTRNGKKVSEISTTQNTARFSITNTRCGDYSNYSCAASNKVGKGNRHFSLAVLCPPEILNFKGNYELEFSNKLMLSYNVRSNPKPTVGVTFNNTPVLNVDTNMDSVSPYVYKMSLAMEVQQNGKYLLRLSNEIGNNTYDIQVSSTERARDSSSTELNGPFSTSLIAILAVSVGSFIIIIFIVISILHRKFSKHGSDQVPAIVLRGTPNDVYASVNKPSWRKANTNPDNKTEVAEVAAAAESQYNEIETSSNLATNSRKTNQDGLIYIDVAFQEAPKEVSEHQVIHGNDDKTIYTTVSHTLKGAFPDDD